MTETRAYVQLALAVTVLALLTLAGLAAIPSAMATLTVAEEGYHYVYDLDSHLAMCEEDDILDKPDCIRVAYETWED